MRHQSTFGLLTTAIFGMALGCAGSDDPSGDSTTGSTLGGTTTGTPDPDSSGGDGDVCVPGMQSSCACPGGADGVQVCLPDGSGLDACECPDDDTGGDTSTGGPPDMCGNGECDAEEDCDSCEMDCGVCEPCTAAPSCEGAQIPPVIDTHADFLDDPMAYVPPIETLALLTSHVEEGTDAAAMIAAALSPAQVGEAAFVTALRDAFAAHPAGAAAVRRQLTQAGMADPVAYRNAHAAPTELELHAAATAAAVDGLTTSPAAGGGPCDDPRMRVRVATLIVHEEDDDFANDEVYCAITSEASAASEIKITPMTPALDEGDQHSYSLEGGLVWGQSDLVAPAGNLLLNYNCIESDTANGYSDLLDAVAGAANAAGAIDIPGVDGWVFPAVGVVAGLLSGALSLDGDDLLFNGSQVIPETEMLNLTTGAWWSVRRDGTNLNSDWDWELRMEIWGCHDNAG